MGFDDGLSLTWIADFHHGLLSQNLFDELIAPHRSNRKLENYTQDGRPLRRYKHEP